MAPGVHHPWTLLFPLGDGAHGDPEEDEVEAEFEGAEEEFTADEDDLFLSRVLPASIAGPLGLTTPSFFFFSSSKAFCIWV